MEHEWEVAVIGGGAAGYTAAMYCRRAGLQTVVLERLVPGGQMATTGLVENYPGFGQGIDGAALSEKMHAGAEQFGVQSVFQEVTQVQLDGPVKTVVTTDGSLAARAVIFATGAAPRELGLPEERTLRGHGVSYCAACDGMLYRGKTVAVAGGGNSAVGEAAQLARLCKKVYLIHRRDTLQAGHSEQQALRRAGAVELLWETEVAALLGQHQLTGLQLRTRGRLWTLPCDGLFVAIGREPNSQLAAAQLQLDRQGYIVAGETTQTALPGVFAAGDVRTKPLRQIVTAAADGAVAARFAERYLRGV